MQNQILNGVSPQAVTPQINPQNLFLKIQQEFAKSMQQIQMLRQQGLISEIQRQYLETLLKEKAQSIVTSLQNEPSADPSFEAAQTPQNPFELFNQEKPGFFEQGGRNVVLNYLKGLDVDKDEISKIADMIEGVEKSAIDGYLKQSAYDKSLNDENMAAKSKLTSYAQNASSGKDIGRIFTRAEIGNMTGDEFAKNEKLIMEQVKQGLIK